MTQDHIYQPSKHVSARMVECERQRALALHQTLLKRPRHLPFPLDPPVKQSARRKDRRQITHTWQDSFPACVGEPLIPNIHKSYGHVSNEELLETRAWRSDIKMRELITYGRMTRHTEGRKPRRKYRPVLMTCYGL